MARRADLFLRARPSTDLVWLSAVSRYILDQGLAHTDFLNRWVNNLEEYRKSLEPFSLEAAAQRVRQGDPKRIATALMTAAEEWSGSPEQADDMTVIVAKLK